MEIEDNFFLEEKKEDEEVKEGEGYDEVEGCDDNEETILTTADLMRRQQRYENECQKGYFL